MLAAGVTRRLLTSVPSCKQPRLWLACLPTAWRSTGPRLPSKSWTAIGSNRGAFSVAEKSSSCRMSAMSAAATETGAVVVYVTVPDAATGKALARGLVEGQLAACVNIIPGLTSVYMWKGQVNEDQEQLLMIKSSQSALPKLTEWVKGKHPYDECEVISVPITGGSESYLQWLHDNVK